MFKLLLSVLLLSFSAIAEEQAEENFLHDKNNATIQVLNKITAKTQYFKIPVKSSINHGTLTIKVNSCWQASPYDLSENKILLEISEKKIGEKEYKTIFNGWMFSSSPGISSLEHSIYDVVAINCF